MGKYVQPMSHKGKQIWLLNAANKDEKEAVAGWNEARQLMAREWLVREPDRAQKG